MSDFHFKQSAPRAGEQSSEKAPAANAGGLYKVRLADDDSGMYELVRDYAGGDLVVADIFRTEDAQTILDALRACQTPADRAPAADAAALPDERALFEAIERERGSDLGKAWGFGTDGEYANPAVENRWKGWQMARAQHRAPATSAAALCVLETYWGIQHTPTGKWVKETYTSTFWPRENAERLCLNAEYEPRKLLLVVAPDDNRAAAKGAGGVS